MTLSSRQKCHKLRPRIWITLSASKKYINKLAAAYLGLHPRHDLFHVTVMILLSNLNSNLFFPKILSVCVSETQYFIYLFIYFLDKELSGDNIFK